MRENSRKDFHEPTGKRLGNGRHSASSTLRSSCAKWRKGRGGLPECGDLRADVFPMAQEVWRADALGDEAPSHGPESQQGNAAGGDAKKACMDAPTFTRLKSPRRTLLHTSFRLRLTTAPLRFANPSPASGGIEDFHFLAVGRAWHTKEGRRKRRPSCRQWGRAPLGLVLPRRVGTDSRAVTEVGVEAAVNAAGAGIRVTAVRLRAP